MSNVLILAVVAVGLWVFRGPNEQCVVVSVFTTRVGYIGESLCKYC